MASKKIYLSHQTFALPQRIKYTCQFIENHPLNKQQLIFVDQLVSADVVIRHGQQASNESSDYSMPALNHFFAQKNIPLADLKLTSFEVTDSKVIHGITTTGQSSAWLIDHHFQFDLFETIFCIISRYEEWHALDNQLDRHNRMKAEEQLLVKNELHRIPVVDRLVAAFLDLFLPDRKVKKTSIRITHDIDDLEKMGSYLRLLRSFAGVIKRGVSLSNISILWNQFQEKRNGGNDPYDTYDWMLSAKAGFEKILYLHVGKAHQLDSGYRIDQPMVQKIIRYCKERNYQLGIHPGYQAARAVHQMQKEFDYFTEQLGTQPQYSRQHFLRFIWPTTPDQLEKQGIKDDSSLGFAEQIGFRCGTGFAYPLYNFDEERPYRFTETPMIVMDLSLLREGNYEEKKIEKTLYHFMEENQYDTYITFNFHNSRFDDAALNGVDLKRIYLQLIEGPANNNISNLC